MMPWPGPAIGGGEKGVTHIDGYGTASGGYALVEVDDPKTDLDVAPAPTIAEPRAKG